MDSKNTHLILFSAAFLVLGFVLGRVTVLHHGPHGKRGTHKGCEAHEGHGEFMWVGEGDTDVQVMMLSDEEFEGDTVFTLPGGGTVNVVRNGEEVEVEVEMDDVDLEELMGDVGKHVRVTREEGADGEVRVEKRVIVVREEE